MRINKKSPREQKIAKYSKTEVFKYPKMSAFSNKMRVHRIENRQKELKKQMKNEDSSKNESSIGLGLGFQKQIWNKVCEK